MAPGILLPEVDTPKTPPGFRAIIAGGGVAGLLLANALERGGIDYVLLERRNELAANVGASIAMIPMGCRVGSFELRIPRYGNNQMLTN